ncbi:hypothetical protein [Nocardia sp. NPDC019395]|uniref:hypothetical protein n=1 Tax=Nocardia sp. NPDC019395 TaxID=3154686 RepID=UPI00340F06BA
MFETKIRVPLAVAITVALSGLIAGCGVDPEQWVQYFTSTPGRAKITFADDRQSVFVMNPARLDRAPVVLPRLGQGDPLHSFHP